MTDVGLFVDSGRLMFQVTLSRAAETDADYWCCAADFILDLCFDDESPYSTISPLRKRQTSQ